MANKKLKLPPFDGISLGSIITCRPDVTGKLLHGILLKITGTGSPTLAEYLEYVEIRINGERKTLLRPTFETERRKFLNVTVGTVDTLYLYVPLADVGYPGSHWGTADVGTFEIVARVVAANPSGKTMTAIDGWLYCTEAAPQKMGETLVQVPFYAPTPVAGWNTVVNIPLEKFKGLARAWLNLDVGAAAITEVRLSVGDKKVYESTLLAAKEALKYARNYKDVASGTVFPIVFDDIGFRGDFLPLGAPVTLEYYWDTGVAAVGAFGSVLECIEAAK